MKKIKAWWNIVKQDAAEFVNSPTVQTDIETLKADALAMVPEIFNELEQVLAKILIETL